MIGRMATRPLAESEYEEKKKEKKNNKARKEMWNLPVFNNKLVCLQRKSHQSLGDHAWIIS